jgi:hypothetical protein
MVCRIKLQTYTFHRFADFLKDSMLCTFHWEFCVQNWIVRILICEIHHLCQYFTCSIGYMYKLHSEFYHCHHPSRHRPFTACSSSEFNFWTYESIWTFGRTPWTGDQPATRPLPIQDNTTRKNADPHPCPKWDSNLQSWYSSGQRQYKP